ncbi:MAG TPA: phosphatase PAP2 family protein, partial [Nocardioides sp.]|nr:phosphatase PAP2 family protein [Nocardioides sp.]
PVQITSRTRDAARSLSLAWVVLVVGVVAVGWLLTGPLEPTVDPWDDSVVESIADRRTPTMDVVAAWGSHVADTIVGVIVAAVAALVLWRIQGTRRPLVYFALLVVGTLALYLVVTLVISRSRPPVEILDPGLVPEHSFPSGHVATSVVVYCALAVYLARTVRGSLRWAWLLFLAPVVVAPSRLYEGAHHPTDVLTSLVFAPLWVAAVAHVLLPGRSDGPDKVGA